MTDAYELTMGGSYLRRRMTAPATFSLFARQLQAAMATEVAGGIREPAR